MKVTQLLALAASLRAAAAIPVTVDEISQKSAQGLHLVQLSADEEPIWMTFDEEMDLVLSETNFMDVTHTYARSKKLGAPKVVELDYPSPSRQSIVEPLLSELTVEAQRADLTELTSFHNRFYTTQSGVDAAKWIVDRVAAIASDAGRDDITVTPFKHDFEQPSTIVRFEGADPEGDITILGGHMDSINGSNRTLGRAPGADDDGSGTVNLIDIIRVLAKSGYKPATPLEFMFYGGEEVGLLGSADIALHYREQGKIVKAVLQLDMTAYPGGPTDTPTFSLVTDNVSTPLTDFVRQLVTSYSTLPISDSHCGYACSDHASWTKNGFPAAFPFEAQMGVVKNNYVHTAADTIDAEGFSFEHSLQFARVGLGFAVELTSA